jgi:hypothetical protein
MNTPYDHFHGKTALQHIAEIQASGVSSSTEIHGAETPGPFFAFLDAAKDTALLLAILTLAFDNFSMVPSQKWGLTLCLGLGWALWKGFRSCMLAWSRLSRLHRIAGEELLEIQTNRPQEKEELMALYRSKGFQGELLDRVVNVLMADQDRLLKVMLQEEMGYRLEEHHHPIIQGICAAAGACGVCTLIVLSMFGFSLLFSLGSMILTMALFGAWFARLEKNPIVPAFFWNFMQGICCCVAVKTFMEFFSK